MLTHFPSFKYWLSLIIGCGLGLILSPPVSLASTLELRIEAPISLRPLAERLQNMNPQQIESIINLVGLETPGPPIQVMLAPDDSPLAQQTPQWVSGYALGESSRVVLLTDRVTSYPYHSLEEVLLHEIGHILTHRASGGRDIPRWFHEGLAMVAARTWEIEDRARLVWAMITSDQLSLEELDLLFQQDEASARQAYVLAHAFLIYLMEQTQPDFLQRLLSRVKHGIPFPDAFAQTTFKTLARAEEEFWDRQTVWNRWVPVATSSAMVWLFITFLSIVVYKKQRQRTSAIQQRWREDDWDS